MLLICYKKCGTCRNVEKILQEKNIEYEYRNIDSQNPTIEELKLWHEKSELAIQKFFNSSGMIYREHKLKDKLPQMSLDEKYELLATDGMLVKRPILLHNDKIYVGPQVKKFVESL
ncbi:MAG: Spx/MgsR family RNA polymerase-binding regulatory protein [Clostridiaceae bacterium]|nr:Spx/MgsR family RNA polymerase-binding regulatory protein [Clostridiaceae bacterium]